MTTQPEALRLAEVLEAWTLGKPTHHREAAAELRRLHAVNQELLEALKKAANHAYWPDIEKQIRATIKKAEGEV
jgi:hypothetical protein